MANMPSSYYNHFDPNNRYKSLLFRSKRGLQSSELNEMQSALHHEIQSIGDVLFGDGSLLKGGSITRKAPDSPLWVAQKGLFYARGYVHDLESVEFHISETETVSVGIAIRDEAISEDQDPRLRAPEKGTINYNQPGAHRLRVEARWTKERDTVVGEQFYVIAQFIDGGRVNKVSTAPELSATRDMIARYDFNSNGSYVITGLGVTYVERDVAAKEHILSVAEGQGNVEGYEQTFQYAQRVRVQEALDVRRLENEPVTFTGDGQYALRWGPIATVSEVNGIVEVTKTVTHGNFLGVMDLLPNAPVVSISSVKQGDTVFEQGISWVQNGDYVDWTPNGPEPSPGSAYQVTFRYSDRRAATISPDGTRISITGFAPGTVAFVDYSHYISRYDSILLNRSGQLVVVKGVPDYLNPVPPKSTFGLQLATVYLRNGSVPVITMDVLRAFRFSDIQELKNQVEDITYNLSRLTLAESIRAANPTTTMRGYFVDPFRNDAMRDAGVAQNAIIVNQFLTHHAQWVLAPVTQAAKSFLGFTERAAIEQPFHTKSRKIHAYASLLPPPATLSISPSTYQWITGEIAKTIYTNSGSGVLTRTTTTTTRTTTWTGDTAVLPMPPTKVNLKAGKFNANEKIDIFFDSVIIETVNADASGELTHQITTPTWATSGSKQIKVVGRDSMVEGSQVFTGQPGLVNVITNIQTVKYDPLAQTFSVDQDQFVTSVDLQFAVNSPAFVDVFLTEVQLGVPDRTKIFARRRIMPEDIKVNPAGGVWTKVTFDNPARILRDVEYAIIVAAPESVSELRVAELGGYDSVNKRWISTQASEEGILLESANLSSWSAIPKEDLTYRLNTAKFEQSRTVTLPSVSVSNATDLILLTATDLMAGTSVQFIATLLDRANEEIVVSPYEPVTIAQYTGAVALRAILSTTNPNLTPVIDGDISWAVGVLQTPSTYITRSIVIPAGVTTFKAYLEVLEQSGSSISIEYRNQADTAWVALTRDPTNAVNLGSGWVEMPFNATGISGVTATRLRISLQTSDLTKRAYGANLRFFFS